MDHIHRVIDKGESDKLLDYDMLDMDSSYLEMLIGMDVCQYRMMPCKAILGDRSIVITEKRYKSKMNMLDVYKEAAAQKKDKTIKKVFSPEESKTIFDLDLIS